MAAVSYEMPGDKSKFYLYGGQHGEQYFLLLFFEIIERGNGA